MCSRACGCCHKNYLSHLVLKGEVTGREVANKVSWHVSDLNLYNYTLKIAMQAFLFYAFLYVNSLTLSLLLLSVV